MCFGYLSRARELIAHREQIQELYAHVPQDRHCRQAASLGVYIVVHSGSISAASARQNKRSDNYLAKLPMSKQLPFPIKYVHWPQIGQSKIKTEKKKNLPFLVAMKQAIEPETGNFRPCALSHFFKPPAG
jgi:hypothetical protein